MSSESTIPSISPSPQPQAQTPSSSLSTTNDNIPTSTVSACKVIAANEVAAQFITSLTTLVSTEYGNLSDKSPLIVSFLANEDPAAVKYAEWTGKTAKQIGFRFELRIVQRTLLEEHIINANNDKEVNGIMVYYPVFGGSMDQYLQNIVSPSKDVEGLCHTYRYNLYHNIRFIDPPENKRKCIIPCTPLAVLKILEHVGVYNKVLSEGNRLHGRVITVINRSEVVGRPLAALLANDGAIVYSFDEYGGLLFHRGAGLKLGRHQVNETDKTLTVALAESDVVITGVPSSKYTVDTDKLRDGVVAVNFSSQNNFKNDVVNKASIYVPSVGKVTVSMLLRNLVRLTQYQNGKQAPI